MRDSSQAPMRVAGTAARGYSEMMLPICVRVRSGAVTARNCGRMA